MIIKNIKFIYQTENKKTIYRRSCEASLEDNDYTNRELVFGERELGTVADDSIIKELCERHVNYFELGTAVAKYYRDNILNR